MKKKNTKMKELNKGYSLVEQRKSAKVDKLPAKCMKKKETEWNEILKW